MNKKKRTAQAWAKQLQEAFEIEKNAKNEAYYFILSRGLLDEFAAFSRAYKPDDPHGDCVKWLEKTGHMIKATIIIQSIGDIINSCIENVNTMDGSSKA